MKFYSTNRWEVIQQIREFLGFFETSKVKLQQHDDQ